MHFIRSDETLAKLRQAWVRRKLDPSYKVYCKQISERLKGRKKSEEHVRKMREVSKGKITPEWRQKLIAGHVGLKMPPHSAEAKLKMRLKKLGKIDSPTTRENKRIAALHKRINKFKNTNIERIVRAELEKNNVDFKFQEPIQDVTIVDFYLPDSNIIIMCDGCFWHGCSKCRPGYRIDQPQKDAIITNKLLAKGYRVFRFWEHDIKQFVYQPELFWQKINI